MNIPAAGPMGRMEASSWSLIARSSLGGGSPSWLMGKHHKPPEKFKRFKTKGTIVGLQDLAGDSRSLIGKLPIHLRTMDRQCQYCGE